MDSVTAGPQMGIMVRKTVAYPVPGQLVEWQRISS